MKNTYTLKRNAANRKSLVFYLALTKVLNLWKQKIETPFEVKIIELVNGPILMSKDCRQIIQQ